MTASKNDSTITNSTKIALLEQSIGHIYETLLRMEKRFDSLESKLESKIDRGFSECRQLSWSHFRWLLGTILVSLIIPVIKGFFI